MKIEYATDINLKFRKKNKPDNPLNYKNMSDISNLIIFNFFIWHPFSTKSFFFISIIF